MNVRAASLKYEYNSLSQHDMRLGSSCQTTTNTEKNPQKTLIYKKTQKHINWT